MKPKRIFKRLLPRPEGRPARWPALRNVLHKIKRALWLAAVLAGPVLAQSGRPQRVSQAGPWDTSGSTVAVRCLNAAGTAFESCAGGGESGGAGANGANVTSTFTVITATGAGAASFLPSRLSDGTNFYNGATQTTLAAVLSALQGTLTIGGAVTATLAAETTKVIGTVNIAAGQTIGVTGTFWQATQPVSGPLTDEQLRASPVPVAVDKSTVVIQGSNGAVVTVTGNSMNVNCTGGCGSPTQAVTWVAFSTTTAGTSKNIFGIMNGASSTKVVKIQNVSVGQASDSAVTGLVFLFRLYTVTSFTGGFSTAPVRAADTNDGAFPPDANITRITGATSVAGLAGPYSTVTVSTEETALQATPKDLYSFENSGGKPLTLRPGQGVVVRQGELTGSAGIVAVRIEFTTE